MSQFRHPKTHQEKSKSDDPEVRDLVRPKRSSKTLVSSWDDIQESGGRRGSKKPRKRWSRKTL